MADTQLTAYLLDSSLLNYTLECTQAALTETATTTTCKRAQLAVDFFLSLLDPMVESEKKYREAFQRHLEALNKEKATQISLPDLRRSRGTLNLSAAQSVLTLPETLGEILSHISPLTVEGRNTFHSVSLVSRSFHQAADRTLWQTPRDLDSVEQQVQFTFGAAISGALSDPLGSQVEGLRIRRMPGGWNDRIIIKIAALCPQVRSLLLHCGDTEDGDDPITQSFINTLHNVLSSLPNLKDLALTKFSFTPTVNELQFASDAHRPFKNLVSLRLYDFGWYWPFISKGVAANLKSLDLGLLPTLTSEQLILLARQTSITNLSISSHLELEPLREFASNGLIERLLIKQFDMHDDKYAKDLFSIVTSNLPNLKVFTLRGVQVGFSEFETLTRFNGPLEEIGLQICEGISHEDANTMIIKLVKSKRKTLRIIEIEFEGTFELNPSEELINALSDCALLEQILIPFASQTGPSLSTTVDSLLIKCQKLELTWSLEILCEGNELYEKKYKEKLHRLEEDRDDVVLGT